MARARYEAEHEQELLVANTMLLKLYRYLKDVASCLQSKSKEDVTC